MEKDQGLRFLVRKVMLEDVPSYANKFFYSLGFLSATSFFLLLVSGMLLILRGPSWWLTTPLGIYLRSMHLWSTQAFVVFIFLHILIVFFTYAYRSPRQLIWILGGVMFFLVLFEAEFGYILRGDFSSQWRGLQASDLYNGSGLGHYINNLNYTQIYGIHIAVLPLVLIAILGVHYALVRSRGIAKPHREDIHVKMVKANHLLLFSRGLGLVVVVLVLAKLFPSPLVAPVTIEQIATNDPGLMAQTLVAEFQKTSDTATYSDNIQPYTYDTREVYVFNPYKQYIQLQDGTENFLDIFLKEDADTQSAQADAASSYYENNDPTTKLVDDNPVIPMIGSVVRLAQTGLYTGSLRGQASDGYNPTYVTRFLADTGVLEEQATTLGITTEQYGMIREESGHLPSGAWWLIPVGWLDHTILANDENQDQHGAEILGGFMLLFLAFPYIPFLNRIPEKLSIYKLIWKEKDPMR